MVGKTGSGKSASANTILGSELFESKCSAESQTKICKKLSHRVNGRKVSVIDTPGFFDTGFSEEKNLREIRKCISRAAPGPHAFLAVIQIGRFTEEEKKSLENTQEAFGQESDKYTMILFTHGDQLTCSVGEFMKNSPELQELLRKYSGFYHVFNNKTKGRSQVTKLLEKINQIVEKNGGSFYTNEMFQKAKRQGLLKEVKEHEEQYEMNSKPTGLCLIIANERFEDGRKRPSAIPDAGNMGLLFNMRGFRVLKCKDLTGSQMKKTLECISSVNITELQQFDVQEYSRKDRKFTDLHVENPLQHTDAFVCYISSKGAKGGVEGTDRQTLSIEDMTTPFKAEKCPVLENKPKVFLLEAGLEEEDLPEEHSMEEDFLLAVANKQGYVAHGDPNGGFFTQSVLRHLLDGRLRGGEDIQIVLNNVIKEVSKRETPRGREQQIPDVIINTLKKNLMFKRILQK